MTGTVEFGSGVITFGSYPFSAASVYPRGRVAVADIRDVDPDADPPEVRLHRGETLFVSAQPREELRAFCEGNGVPVRRRPDVWGDLLEPFLDTEFRPEDDARTAARLARVGLDAATVAGIRADVGDAMVAYNFDSGLWDWVHLGLSDLLQARSGVLAGERFRLPPDEYDEFYWKSMFIADLGYDQNSSQA